MTNDSVANQLRRLLESRSVALAQAWLEVLLEELELESSRVFPQRTLLNHVPLLLRRLAEALTGGDPFVHDDVQSEIVQLARLRRSQGYAAAELMREFELLSSLVMDEIEGACAKHDREWPLSETLIAIRRMQETLVRLARGTMEAFAVDERSDHYERAQLLDSFGRTITHELRNRLNAVRLALNLHEHQLRQEPLDRAALSEGSAGLGRRLERIESVVEDVFIVAIAHGRADPSERAFRPLDEVVEQAIADAQPHANELDVRLHVRGELPSFTVDGTRVGLILMNLLSNGIKYSDGNGEAPRVEISSERIEDSCWDVRVADNGIGIPKREQSKVFERYHRGAAPETIDGQGIGLFLAQRAAAQLGSELRLESEPGRGTMFAFRIREPREQLDKAPPSTISP